MDFNRTNHHSTLSPEQELAELETFCLDYFENQDSDYADIAEFRQEILNCAEV